MEYRDLGTSGLRLSVIGLGCEPLGGADWGHVNLDDAVEAVRAAWDLGINVFDTSDVYGLGESERRLATALGDKRKQAILVTKGGVRWSEVRGKRANTWKDCSAQYLRHR